MTTSSTGPKRLYLLELSPSTVPIGVGRTLEMVLGCYLVQTGDGRQILIESGIAADARPAGSPPARNQKNVIEHVAELGLRPEDIDIVIATHFDVDHAGSHEAFQRAVFIVE